MGWTSSSPKKQVGFQLDQPGSAKAAFIAADGLEKGRGRETTPSKSKLGWVLPAASAAARCSTAAAAACGGPQAAPSATAHAMPAGATGAGAPWRGPPRWLPRCWAPSCSACMCWPPAITPLGARFAGGPARSLGLAYQLEEARPAAAARRRPPLPPPPPPPPPQHASAVHQRRRGPAERAPLWRRQGEHAGHLCVCAHGWVLCGGPSACRTWLPAGWAAGGAGVRGCGAAAAAAAASCRAANTARPRAHHSGCDSLLPPRPRV